MEKNTGCNYATSSPLHADFFLFHSFVTLDKNLIKTMRKRPFYVPNPC